MSAEAPAVPPSAPRPRPQVPFAATVLTALVGAGMLAATCAGGAMFAMARGARPHVERSAARRAATARQRDRVTQTRARLTTTAAGIAAKARNLGELPEALDEAPPKDLWNRPVEYERLSPERAVLRSAGPDGKFGTPDDVRCDVVK